MSPRCVLVGPPGAGKTTVGRQLAALLQVGFRDTDEDVVAVAGKSISEVFFDDGEDAFRALEQAAVATALTEHDGVLSLGGGAVLSAETRQLLQGHQVVLLSVGLPAAAKRVGLSRDRPVLAINPRATLAALMAERTPLYAQVATMTFATDDCSPAEVARQVAEALT